MSAEGVVLDASAVLALINQEPGSEVVEGALQGASISAVNLSEVAGKLIDRGMSEADARRALDSLQLPVHDFDRDMAYAAAGLRKRIPSHLGLGDRACLALARVMGAVAMTADAEWAMVKVRGLAVRLIR